MWKISYSSSALVLAMRDLQILDKFLEQDLDGNFPIGVPTNNEWQLENILSIFDRERQRKAAKRVSFNLGVVVGICRKHYDGSASDFDYFVKTSIKSSIFYGKKIAKSYPKVSKKFPDEFFIGNEYSIGFMDRWCG